MNKRVIVTITPPTPNGDMHLGHLSGPFLSADICQRRLKQLGYDVLFVSYSDDYQSYLPRKTDQLLREPFEYAHLVRDMLLTSMKSADIYLDHFLQSSSSPEFSESAAHYVDCVKDQIKLEDQKTFQCDACQRYGYEGFGRGKCNWCGESSDASQCENCARMPDINQMHEMQCMSCGGEMRPVQVKQHVWHLGQNYPAVVNAHSKQPKRDCLSSYLETVLENTEEKWPITRPGDAGLPLAQLDYKPLHTWFMGLAGYRSTVKALLKEQPEKGTFEDWWKPDTQMVHFLGYDCSFSHAVGYAALQTLDLTGPKTGIFPTNRFLKLNGEDFSTSRGHAIWVKDLTGQYPSDAVRFYTALYAPETEVKNFDLNGFKEWFNKFFTPLAKHINKLKSVSLSEKNSECNQVIVDAWTEAASLNKFSICEMARQLVLLSEKLLDSEHENASRQNWETWQQLALPICPVLAQKVTDLIE